MMQYSAHTHPIGDMEVNMFMGSIMEDDEISIADYSDSYGTGKSSRPLRYVDPPPVLDVRAENGEKGVVAMGDPCWGEGASGNEFEMTRNEDFKDAGWPAIRDVPALFRRGSSTDCAVTVIDDMLVKTKGSQDEAMKLFEFISTRVKARMGGKPLVITYTPRQFAGMRIARTPDRKVITLSVTHFVEAMTRRWLPTLVEDGMLPA